MFTGQTRFWARLAVLPATLAFALPAVADDFAFFESRIRPILAEHCYSCHGAETQRAELRLDHGSFVHEGGESGPILATGDPGASRLLTAVRYEEIDLQMPPRGKLPEAAIADIERWVAEGALWPEEPLPEARGAAPAFDLQAWRDAHWAWQPLTAHEPPSVSNADWPRNDIDRFVLAKLDEHNIVPNPRADKATLLRRLHIDLTGLPPSPETVEAFLADNSPDAYERMVETLLASPHFGEHWGRHWMDVTRYAETYGYELDFTIPHAWRYRDYVIRALNSDVPYDQFVTEHLAGDLMPEPRVHPEEGYNESIIGTGVWYMHQAQHAPVDVRVDNGDRLENQIDVMGKAFMAMTISCARCHDHKFDAISKEDYFAFAGILNSTRRDIAYLDRHGERERAVSQLRARHAEAASALGEAIGEAVDAALEQEGAVPVFAANSKPEPEAWIETLPEDAVLFEDFTQGYGEWRESGDAFGDAPTGAMAWAPQGDAFAFAPANVAHSGLASSKVRGVLRSPTFIIEHENILIRAAGDGTQVRVIIENYTLRENTGLLWGPTFQDVKHGDDFHWVVLSDLTKRLGARAHIELLDDGDGWLAVDAIYFSNERPGEMPEAASPDLPSALDRWLEGTATSTDTAALNASSLDTMRFMRSIPELRLAVRESQRDLPQPIRALAMADGSSIDEPVHIRGNHRTLGEVVPRRFLEAIDGPEPEPFGEGSGRLELAQRMFSDDNPLPPRVMVNRVWHHLFGQGIVPSVDNFGLMGMEPTHPELLDHLAIGFREEGWSIKGLIRELVTTEAYRMSSHPGNADAEERDPTNKWLHRMPIRRVQAEVLRDSILAVAGTLNDTMYGHSVPAYLSDFMGGGHRRPETSGPIDGDGRRSIYLEVRRNFLLPMLLTYDFPPPDTTQGSRSVSNTPAQSLVLMNDPFVVEQAAHWARRVLEAGDATLAERLDSLYLRAFGRPSTETERILLNAFLEQVYAEFDLTQDEAWTDERVWTEVCHAMFMLKEFSFVS